MRSILYSDLLLFAYKLDGLFELFVKEIKCLFDVL